MYQHEKNANARLGQRLKLARTNREMSLHDLCDALDDRCQCELIENYELGRLSIPAVHLKQLSDLLAVPVEWLLHDGPLLDVSGEWHALQLYRSLSARQQNQVTQLLQELAADVVVSMTIVND